MANLKNTEIDNNLELPSGTTAQRPASPQEGQIRYNTDLGVTEFYNGSNWRPLSDTHVEATGGTVVDTDIGGVPYRIHYFTETGTDTLTVTNPGEVEYLIVAGGGGGGNDRGGGWGAGGGAGGVIQGYTNLSIQPYEIVVGSGGDAAINGQTSTAFGLTAVGGGAGGNHDDDGNSGGSGGGGGTQNGIGGSGTPGQGNPGGNSSAGTLPGDPAGGGGGAGSPGLTPFGGQGISSAITGNVQLYAGGGGGSANQVNIYINSGGLGGGGGGYTTAIDLQNNNGFSGDSNTGGGGGGGVFGGDGGNGGSGIVIIRYPRNSSLDSEPDRTVVATQPNSFQTVRDGLVLELDAGNPVSYSGTGDTWQDLSGTTEGASINSGFNFEMNQFSYFYQDNYAGASTPSTTAYLFGAGDGITFESWIFPFEIPTGFSSYQAVLTIGGEVTTKRDRMFQIRLTYAGAGNFDSLYRNSANSVWNIIRTTSDLIQSNQWYHLVSAYTYGDGGSWKLYINGEEQPTTYSQGDGNDSPIQPNTTQAHIGIGEDGIESESSEFMPGRIAQSRIYRKQLTDQEIQQNFNATRSRYGI